jgi:hypothetical protein
VVGALGVAEGVRRTRPKKTAFRSSPKLVNTSSTRIRRRCASSISRWPISPAIRS